MKPLPYTGLGLSVGARADFPFPGYTVYLLAGNAFLVSGHKGDSSWGQLCDRGGRL
jgi:hypothetical protein